MIILAIIVGVFIIALIVLATYIDERYSGNFDAVIFIGIFIIILFVSEICLVIEIIVKPTPSALDVYRGNTELEIIYINGTPIDTVVVFKKN